MEYENIFENESKVDATKVLIRKPDIMVRFAPEGERSRKVVSRSNFNKRTGKHPSWKVGRPVHYESSHEQNFFRLMDVCPAVVTYREQPCVIEYVLDGEKHIHYPDAHIQLGNRRELVEVKTEVDASHPDVSRRTEFMSVSLPWLGFGYRVVTAETLAKNPRLDNAKYFLRHGYLPVCLSMREHIRQIFKLSGGAVAWGSLVHGSNCLPIRNALCRMILEGAIQFDYELPLSSNSLISANSRETGM